MWDKRVEKGNACIRCSPRIHPAHLRSFHAWHAIRQLNFALFASTPCSDGQGLLAIYRLYSVPLYHCTNVPNSFDLFVHLIASRKAGFQMLKSNGIMRSSQ
jgi:hypothetical protein